MKKVVAVLVLLGFVSAMTAFGEEAAVGLAVEKAAPAAKTTCVFTCDKCHGVALAAGKCPMCAADMKALKVLAVKDGMAYCCACGADCKCTMKDAAAAQCECGKNIVKLGLKGKFVCGCGADCKCNTISDKAGKCGCGKDLVEVK